MRAPYRQQIECGLSLPLFVSLSVCLSLPSFLPRCPSFSIPRAASLSGLLPCVFAPKATKINKMAPSAGHWLSYGVREDGEGGRAHTQHSDSDLACKCNACILLPPCLALLQLADSLCAPFTPLYAPTPLHCTSVADMIYALMSRFFDKVLNL